jgi:putative oxidoreductase
MAYLFIPAGWGKIAGFTGVAGYIASKGLPMPEVLAAATIVVELGLGLLLLIGWKARWAALGLALFVAFITPIFHAYWALPEAQQMMQKQSFDKNLAIVGGLLFLTAFGAGGFSVDGRRGQA